MPLLVWGHMTKTESGAQIKEADDLLLCESMFNQSKVEGRHSLSSVVVLCEASVLITDSSLCFLENQIGSS